MPMFTIESSYRIPVYRHRAYEAETLEAACHLAAEDDDWEGQQEDYESATETYASGAWPGDVVPYSVDQIPIPAKFRDRDLSAQDRATIHAALIFLADAQSRTGAAGDAEAALENLILAAWF